VRSGIGRIAVPPAAVIDIVHQNWLRFEIAG
jgi:hypothetical protein